MKKIYYKDIREGRELDIMICQEPYPAGDYILEHLVEIDEDEYNKLYSEREAKVKLNVLLRQIKENSGSDKDGTISFSDFDKIYILGPDYSAVNLDPTKTHSSQDESRISSLESIINSGEDLPIIDAYYNSVLDMYVVTDGYHRCIAHHRCSKDIDYCDRFPEFKSKHVATYLEKHKDEKELIELGEISSTTLTDEQYKDLLKIKLGL